MGYTVTSTTAPTITSSSGLVAPTIEGGVLGLTRVGIGQQAAVGDMVRVFGLLSWDSTLEGPVILTIPLPYKAEAAPLCCTYSSDFVLSFNPNDESEFTAIQMAFTATLESGTAFVAFDYMTATANT